MDVRKLSLPASGRLIVFADGEVDQGPLHTNFELSPSGGELVLTAPDGWTDGGLVYGETPTPDEPPAE